MASFFFDIQMRGSDTRDDNRKWFSIGLHDTLKEAESGLLKFIRLAGRDNATSEYRIKKINRKEFV